MGRMLSTTRGFGMPEGQPLEFSGVSKRFGSVMAVSDLTARVEPGRVTGFLGPNGAGKTTTLRMLLGLVKPTAGSATIGGIRYADLARPLQTVGAVLEASSFHPGRTAAAHLTVYAQAAGVAKSRVDEVLGLVGLADAAGRRIGGFSLGMRQRLGLAYALLGDPGVLVLDEPTNGLDPEGIRWIRGFLRELAREGRTVLVSSHVLAEVQQTVDALLIISRGRLVFQGTLDELSDPAEHATVVDAPDRVSLAAALRAADVPFEVLRSGLTVRGVEPAAVGKAVAAAGIALSTLHKRGPALEEVFLELVDGRRVHHSAVGVDAPVSGAAGAPAAESEDAAGTPAAVGVAATEAGASAAADDATDAAGATDASGADEAVTSAGADATAAEARPTDTSAAPDADVSVADAAAARSPELATTNTATYAVARTGVIDIVPPASSAADAGEHAIEDDAAAASDAPPAPEDADPDVEAIGAIDQELSASDPDRPWESKVKTESDVEADRFFSSFDARRAEGKQAVHSPSAPNAEHPADPDHEGHDTEGGEPR